MNNKLERKYGLFTAICMVVGIVIGSGVFFKAQTILQITNGDMPLGVIAWLIGGAIMLACILTFAGMSQKYEKVNGIVDYAEATVGPKYGYYMGWFLSTIYYPSLTAALAWLSARYTLVFLTTMFPNMPLLIHINEGGVVVGPECIALMLFYLCCSMPSTRFPRSSQARFRHPPRSSSSSRSASWRSSASLPVSPRVS